MDGGESEDGTYCIEDDEGASPFHGIAKLLLDNVTNVADLPAHSGS